MLENPLGKSKIPEFSRFVMCFRSISHGVMWAESINGGQCSSVGEILSSQLSLGTWNLCVSECERECVVCEGHSEKQRHSEMSDILSSLMLLMLL